MTYSVLLLGATGTVGSRVAPQLAAHASELKRVAFLTPSASTSADKEAKYASIPLERMIGAFDDPKSYEGFDIVISAVGDPLCEDQIKFADAAFEAGVKHFYPAEYGVDLRSSESAPEPYFANKIKVRNHLEARAAADPSIGYTYIMTGMFSDFMLGYNILGLAEDRTEAYFTGSPDARVTVTHGDDCAKALVLSLLPTHLPSLNLRRPLRFSAFTGTVAELFTSLLKAIGKGVQVKYGTKEESYVYELEQKAAGNEFFYKFTSARRALGFGGAEMKGDNNGDYPELEFESWEETCTAMLK